MAARKADTDLDHAADPVCRPREIDSPGQPRLERSTPAAQVESFLLLRCGRRLRRRYDLGWWRGFGYRELPGRNRGGQGQKYCNDEGGWNADPHVWLLHRLVAIYASSDADVKRGRCHYAASLMKGSGH